MRRGDKTWVKNGNTFDRLEIYEPITFSPYPLIFFEKNAPKYANLNLESNFTKYFKRDYPLHLQLICSHHFQVELFRW